MSKFVSVGKILNFHGIQGEAKVGCSRNQEGFLSGLKEVFVKDGNDYKPLKIKSFRMNKDKGIVKFEGINSINEITAYKGAILFVPEEAVREALDEDEFLIDELVGLNVVDENNEKLGFVIGVSNNGVNDLLSVKTKSKKISLIAFGMIFDVMTLFPEMIDGYCSFSILKRAVESGVIKVNTVNPRDFTLDKHRKVDDTPYGGGAGMVLMPQPYVDAYESIEKSENSVTIMLSPQGEKFDEQMSNELACCDQIILMCGHYEGFDERIRDIIKPREISIGDFVLTGGELPALCIMDAVSRKIQGTLGKIESANDDSLADGLLEYPQYTKPREYRGLEVPQVLLNGNHKDINAFRQEQRLIRTKIKRPDLYNKFIKN